jgi:TolA-binding protein
MTYWNNSNVQDVADVITEVEDAYRALISQPVEFIGEHLEKLGEQIGELEGQLRYVDGDIEDLEAYREFAEQASYLGIEDEYDLRDLNDEVEAWRELGDIDEVREKLNAPADEEARMRMAKVIIAQGQVITELRNALQRIMAQAQAAHSIEVLTYVAPEQITHEEEQA